MFVLYIKNKKITVFMAEKEEEVKEIEVKGEERGEKRKVSLKGVTYNNTDFVFNRFKMFK